MERFVLPSVHFWVRLQVAANQPNLILKHYCPFPGQGAAARWLPLTRIIHISLHSAIFFPGNLKMRVETKSCLSLSRSPTLLCHDLKNKARSKAALAVSSKLCLQCAAPSMVKSLAWAPGHSDDPDPGSLAGSPTLCRATNCS